MEFYNLPDKIKTLIFDIDGTLYTSKEYVAEQIDVQVRHWADLNSISHDEGRRRIAEFRAKYEKENNRSIQYVRQTGIDRVAYPEMIIKLAGAQDGFITKQDVAELLKITPDQAYSEIKKLVSEGKIYKYCGGKYTKYKLR